MMDKENDPVACWGKRSAIDGQIYEASRSSGDGFNVPLYTHPQPARQPLTDGQLDSLIAYNRAGPWQLARLVELAHGIGKDKA